MHAGGGDWSSWWDSFDVVLCAQAICASARVAIRLLLHARHSGSLSASSRESIGFEPSANQLDDQRVSFHLCGSVQLLFRNACSYRNHRLSRLLRCVRLGASAAIPSAGNAARLQPSAR